MLVHKKKASHFKMVSVDAYEIRQFTEIYFVSSHRTFSLNLQSLLLHTSVDV